MLIASISHGVFLLEMDELAFVQMHSVSTSFSARTCFFVQMLNISTSFKQYFFSCLAALVLVLEDALREILYTYHKHNYGVVGLVHFPRTVLQSLGTNCLRSSTVPEMDIWITRSA